MRFRISAAPAGRRRRLGAAWRDRRRVIGGPDFGILGEGYLRLSYANSADNIRKALELMRIPDNRRPYEALSGLVSAAEIAGRHVSCRRISCVRPSDGGPGSSRAPEKAALAACSTPFRRSPATARVSEFSRPCRQADPQRKQYVALHIGDAAGRITIQNHSSYSIGTAERTQHAERGGFDDARRSTPHRRRRSAPRAIGHRSIEGHDSRTRSLE